MNVRFLGVQKFVPESGSVSLKINYSTDNSQVNTPLNLDNGSASLSYSGEKQVDIKCTPEAYEQAKGCTPGEIYALKLTPNPSNPRFNICSSVDLVK